MADNQLQFGKFILKLILYPDLVGYIIFNGDKMGYTVLLITNRRNDHVFPI